MPGRVTTQAYDIVFEDALEPDGFQRVGVMLARPPKASRQPMQIEAVLEPNELGQVSPPKPVPVVWDEWSSGAGVKKSVRGVDRSAFAVGRNACARFGGVTPAGALHEMDLSGLPPHGRIVTMAPYRGDIYCVTRSRYPLRIEGGVGPIRAATESLDPGTILGDLTVLQNKLYFGCEGGTIVEYDGEANVWAQSTTLQRARIKQVTWTRGGVPRRRLVATDITSTKMLYTTGDDPMNADHWSSEIPIESAYPVQGLVGGPRHVYAIGPGGVFDLTENGETPCITGATWALHYDPSNLATGVLYDGKLYCAAINGIFAISLDGSMQDIMEDVSIQRLRPGDLPIGGRPSPLTIVDGWLVQATYATPTQTSQLWYGKARERLGLSVPWPFAWFGSECDIVGANVQTMCVSSPAGPHPRRLYLAAVDAVTGASRLFWHELPKYGSPLADYAFGQPDRMRYAREWDITQTEEVLGDPATTKTPLWWDVQGRHLGGPNRLTVAAAGRDGAYVDQGTVTTDQLRFGAQVVQDTALSVRVTGANAEDVPAVLDAVKGSWVVTVEETGSVTLPVIFGQGVDLLYGGEDQQDAELTFALLARMTQRQSVQAIAWNGQTMRVRIEQGIRHQWRESPDGQGWLDGAVITLSVLSRPMLHDVGDRHDLDLRHDG